ncbi:MAG: Holliday junction resolvase RuvX [Anaerolineaceae bacterium]|nr:Holliday junction resolvase RuvX [Anaerolineaceae bacterium]
MNSRIMAIDPGDKRIGIAISDPTRTIASPLMVLKHEARKKDAKKIVDLAIEHNIVKIIIGQARTFDGQVSFEGRKAERLAEAIKEISSISIELWDESFSTQKARHSRIEMGVKRSKRKGHLDEIAATIILQTYLEEQII